MAKLDLHLRKMYLRGRVTDEDVPHIDALFNIVVNRHFRGTFDREELLAECRFSVIQLVAKDQFDPTKSALNYTYTRIRNHITNLRSKRKPLPFSQHGIRDGQEEQLLEAPALPYAPEKILESVNELIEEFKLKDPLRKFVRKYFADRFGVKCPPHACYSPLDTFKNYLFYIRIIEWSLIQQYSSLSITNNTPEELLPHLGLTDSQEAILHSLSNLFSREVVEFILYVLSGQSLKIPSRNKLIKIDRGLSIYKTSQRKGKDVPSLARRYGKSPSAILSILEKFSNV